MEKQIIKVGAIKGRHPLPVERYLIEEETVNFDVAHKLASDAMVDLCEQINKTKISTEIHFYVAGLTRVTLGAIQGFISTVGIYYLPETFIELKIFEFNASTKEYESKISYYYDAPHPRVVAELNN